MSTEILAPMPATITEVKVTEEEVVVEGQTLLLLEAMKMEIPIVTTDSGRIKKIEIQAGDKVATHQLLIVVE